jgi:hypothetical protein
MRSESPPDAALREWQAKVDRETAWFPLGIRRFAERLGHVAFTYFLACLVFCVGTLLVAFGKATGISGHLLLVALCWALAGWDFFAGQRLLRESVTHWRTVAPARALAFVGVLGSLILFAGGSVAIARLWWWAAVVAWVASIALTRWGAHVAVRLIWRSDVQKERLDAWLDGPA